mmetsp:Transcript_62862/g.99800  ORF Transcript_62862/g.99800 Transcript_62862/m.99800 type:complete len:412 (+) Transcript_62862:43-1278(+)
MSVASSTAKVSTSVVGADKQHLRYRIIENETDDLPPITSPANLASINQPADSHKEIQKQPKPPPSLLIVHLAIITAQVAFGGGSVIGALGMPETNPVLFALIREGVAGPLLCIIAFLIDKHVPNCREDWSLFIGPGLALWVNQFTFIVGLKISSGILASSWQPSQGILAVLFGWCFGIERHVDTFKIVGILIGTAGALFMIIYGNHDDSGTLDVWHAFGGSIMFFLNCSATVLYLILGRPAFKKYPSSTITGYSYIIATGLMIITAIVVASSDTILHFLCSDCHGAWEVPTVTIYALLYWILMQSLLSYLLMTWANQYADPSVNLAYTVLQPLTSTIASELLLLFKVVPNCDSLASGADKACLYGPSLADLGAIGICIGLYFVIYSDRKKRAQKESLLESVHEHNQSSSKI